MAAAGALALALVRAFQPAPVLVDVGSVARGPLRVTLDDDGRTRVKERYVISAPIQGRLLRNSLRPGDAVRAGQTQVAQFVPVSPDLLDARSRAEAQARILRGEASVREAEALREQARADLRFAQSEQRRMRELRDRQIQPLAALERAQHEVERTAEGLRASEFGVQVARFELELARATLREPGAAAAGRGSAAGAVVTRVDSEGRMELRSPIDGTVLRVHEESGRTLAAGSAILEIGNMQVLEVVADYLSQDAVKIRPGMKVFVERWGGEDPSGEDRALHARVRLVEPAAFTKLSALGVEEQRVHVIVDPLQDAEAWAVLGDGYRVELRVVLWEQDDVLQVPTGALFRQQGSWTVFVVEKGRAVQRRIEIGRQSGLSSQVVAGLAAGERVVLYPGELIHDGVRVRVP